jgi:hypothetical protein
MKIPALLKSRRFWLIACLVAVFHLFFIHQLVIGLNNQEKIIWAHNLSEDTQALKAYLAAVATNSQAQPKLRKPQSATSDLSTPIENETSNFVADDKQSREAEAEAEAEPPSEVHEEVVAQANTDALPETWPKLIPTSLQLNYKVEGRVRGINYSANSRLNWQSEESSYLAFFEVSAFLLGSRTQTSKGLLGPEGLLPVRFSDKTRTEQATHFERDKGLISFSANTPAASLQPGAQDRLSVFIQLASMLAGAPARFLPGTQINIQVASVREAEVWSFKIERLEELDLPIGHLDTIHLTRLPRHEHDIQVELWFAPSYKFLPVRIRLTQNESDVVDQMAKSIDIP